MADENPRRFAVLIDADNTSPRIAAGLFEEIAKFGEASVRRIYGDFSGTRLKSWAEILQKYAIDPYQQFAYTTGKNASDIALVIDAMDLLHSERFDGFCLVSSDSDFTRLASRLREEGADVYGFGARKTPESFRQACRRFIYTENLLPEAPAEAAGEGRREPVPPASAAVQILNRAISQMET
jgi:NYN domain